MDYRSQVALCTRAVFLSISSKPYNSRPALHADGNSSTKNGVCSFYGKHTSALLVLQLPSTDGLLPIYSLPKRRKTDLYGLIKLEIKHLFYLHSRIGFINLISSLKSSSPILTTSHREQFQFMETQFPFINQSQCSMHKEAGCKRVRCKLSKML